MKIKKSFDRVKKDIKLVDEVNQMSNMFFSNSGDQSLSDFGKNLLPLPTHPFQHLRSKKKR